MYQNQKGRLKKFHSIEFLIKLVLNIVQKPLVKYLGFLQKQIFDAEQS
jgi:hypothetical protein